MEPTDQLFRSLPLSLPLPKYKSTSYVFVVTEFEAIGVGKRAIRSNHVKISGRSSLDENRTQVRVTAMAPESALQPRLPPRRAPRGPPCLDLTCVEKLGENSYY
jgi:hypothetical protein